MDPKTQQVIGECAARSHAGSISFPEVIGALVAEGVESYRVDFRQRETSYFVGSGEVQTHAFASHELPIADAFDAQAVREAILGSQQGRVKYPEFVERVTRAGCVGYIVWILGRHVVYFGRRGETHVEHFPS